ncbi:MAG: hypothetical protein ACTIDO_16460 [Brevibacterium aurantiacum]|uniref:hypothetical protein n=1 Tax=Brevibacterium aurantiacum TaxID=273384 RepID=UPI003F91FD76
MYHHCSGVKKLHHPLVDNLELDLRVLRTVGGSWTNSLHLRRGAGDSVRRRPTVARERGPPPICPRPPDMRLSRPRCARTRRACVQ